MKYKTIIGKTVELTIERRKHIFERHPDLAAHFPKVKKVLLDPSEIRIDKDDPSVLLFYKYFSTIGSGKYLAVVIKTNTRAFFLTCYLTNRIRSGEKYELKEST